LGERGCDSRSGSGAVTFKNRGILHSIERVQGKSRLRLSSEPNSDEKVLKLKRSGNYLAFLDEGDPIYLSREMMEWVRERHEPESFLKRLARQFKKH